MQFNTYFVKVKSDSLSFEFFSVRPKGKIKKRIAFQPFGDGSFYYNLGFGDVDDKDEIDDKAVSDNDDSRKVLTTVAYCLGMFLERYPHAFVYIEGSTPARTRLYRIGINNNLAAILENFHVLGYDKEWVNFVSGVDYQAFLIIKK